MIHNKKQQLYISVGIVTLLLLIRIVFFLKDGTNDFIERILFWLIYGGSFVVLYFLFSPVLQNLNYLWRNNKSKIFIFLYIIVLEVLFALKNNLNYTFVSAFSVLFIVSLFFVISTLLPRILAKVFDISFIIIYGGYMFAQDFYYRIFSDFFSFIEAGTLREGVESSSNMYVFNYLHLVIVLMVILTLVLYLANYEHKRFKGKKLNLLKYIFVLFLLVNLNAEYPVKSARMHLSDHYLYTSTYSKTRFVSHFGGINLLTKDVVSLIIPDGSHKKDFEYINNYFENNQKFHIDNEYTDIFKDKNLIIILAESFDDIALSEELTPNILKLKNEGLDFTNHFTPVFPRTTCDTEIILNTSLIPSIQDGPTCYVYNQNSYDSSIANLFNNKDYVTSALHSNYKEFYTRHLVYNGLGYNNFYGQHEIGLSDTERRYDEVFMDMAKDYVINTDNKFYSMMLTLSGHSPYTNVNLAVEKNYELVDEYYQDSANSHIKGYIATQLEVEYLVENLITDLEAKGELDDTVILFTNDHYPYTLDQKSYENYKNIEDEFMKNKGVLYIWSNDIEHQEITKLSSSFDILPTINNMFGLGGNYNDYIGNDILSDTESLVYFKDYTFYDGTTLYDLSKSSEGNESLLNYVRKQYELSRRILKVNYFKEE